MNAFVARRAGVSPALTSRLPARPVAVLRSVGVALTYIPVPQLLKNSLPANLIADQKTNLPAPLQTLLNTLCPLLLFKARPLQITVYLLLEK